MGYGEDAPRYPHILALPVVARPLFPGIITTIQLSDEKTIRAMERLMKRTSSSSKSGFVGVFLRKKNISTAGTSSSSFSAGETPLFGFMDTPSTPELIQDPQELYTVGTFAQIHSFKRGTISLSSHDFSSTSLNHSSSSISSTASSHEDPSIEESSSLSQEDEEEGSNPNKGPASLVLLAHRRIDLLSVDSIGPPIHCTVKHWDRLKHSTYTSSSSSSSTNSDDTIRALSNEILATIRELAMINPLFREHVTFFPTRIDPKDPYRLADFAACLTTGSPEELQAVLEEKDAELRLHKALVLLSKEREVCKLQQEISKKVEEKMTETQRKYFLMEQLKSIKKELGMEKDDKEALLGKYRKKFKELKSWIQKQSKQVDTNDNNTSPTDVSNTTAATTISTMMESNYKEVLETMESEIEKISTLEKNSSEFNMTRSYLDWLTSIPWGHSSPEKLDIQDARSILDRDHYGLEEVKDTILQFIAVGKLKGSIQGKILCLAGPPGK